MWVYSDPQAAGRQYAEGQGSLKWLLQEHRWAFTSGLDSHAVPCKSYGRACLRLFGFVIVCTSLLRSTPSSGLQALYTLLDEIPSLGLAQPAHTCVPRCNVATIRPLVGALSYE